MSKKGFTLVELLVVIVIIGILAAAAISVFGGGTDKAKLNTMRSDVAAMHSAGTLALADQGYGPRGVGTLATKGYLSEVPKNPFITTAVPGFWYAYAEGKQTFGDNTNPVIYAAGIEGDSTTLYDKGQLITGATLSTAGVFANTGTGGIAQAWSGTVPTN